MAMRRPSERDVDHPDLSEMCRLLADRSPDPTLMVDAETMVVGYANPAFRETFGEQGIDPVGRRFDEALPASMATGLTTVVDRVCATGGEERTMGYEPGLMIRGLPFNHWAVSLWSIPGTAAPCAAVIVRVTDLTEIEAFRRQAVEMNQALLVNSVREHELREEAESLSAQLREEITERERAQLALQEMSGVLERHVRERTAELAESNRDLRRYAHTIAHNLRAPLRAIVAGSRLLGGSLTDRLSSEESELLARQAFNALKLSRLIDDLLDYASLSNEILTRAPIDMTDLARRLGEGVTQAFPDRTLQIVVEDDLVAHAGRTGVSLILECLLHNAAKFSPDGGRIEVGRADEAFFVRDEGVGFDMGHTHSLFEPFERLVSEDAFPGNGIGLAKVKRIAARHGGRVWAESSPGEGATFFFTLS